MKNIVVPEHEAGERLDVWLSNQVEGLSRTKAQELVKTGAVAVNGKLAKSGYVLRPNDAVAIPETGEKSSKPEIRQLTQNTSQPNIVDETDDFLVLEKPSGLLVHPAPNQKTDTLIDFLLAHAATIAEVGDSKERPGIVHRLDREASGLMVVAKTPAAFEHLKKQFQAHEIKKEYLALVFGKMAKDTDVIETPIGRKKGLGRMSARTQPIEGDKEAKSIYDVIERFPHASLVRITTETGRMHQVRVHMKSVGHPLVGDSLYAAGKKSPSLDKCPRLFLHAALLGFKDLSGQWREYRSEPPEDLKTFLETLERKHEKR
jgi:23S rRNA pseudouridine1911/1915/1917 synthase